MPDGPRDWSCRVENQELPPWEEGMESAVPRRVRMLVQSVWQEVWKRLMRSEESDKGGGRGWSFGYGSAMLKALWVGELGEEEGEMGGGRWDTLWGRLAGRELALRQSILR